MFVVSIDGDICTGCGLCVEGVPPAYLVSIVKRKAFVSGDETECMDVKHVRWYVKAELLRLWNIDLGSSDQEEERLCRKIGKHLY